MGGKRVRVRVCGGKTRDPLLEALELAVPAGIDLGQAVDLPLERCDPLVHLKGVADGEAERRFGGEHPWRCPQREMRPQKPRDLVLDQVLGVRVHFSFLDLAP